MRMLRFPSIGRTVSFLVSGDAMATVRDGQRGETVKVLAAGTEQSRFPVEVFAFRDVWCGSGGLVGLTLFAVRQRGAERDEGPGAGSAGQSWWWEQRQKIG